MADYDDDQYQDDDDTSSDDDDMPANGGAADDDDVSYEIGRIIVDDGTYEEVEEDDSAATPTDTANTEEAEVEEPVSADDEFLDEYDYDPDDPEQYWGD